jgi:hypothetical protein
LNSVTSYRLLTPATRRCVIHKTLPTPLFPLAVGIAARGCSARSQPIASTAPSSKRKKKKTKSILISAASTLQHHRLFGTSLTRHPSPSACTVNTNRYQQPLPLGPPRFCN